MNVFVRPFEDDDYSRLCEVRAAVDPRSPWTTDELRRDDAVIEPHVRVLQLTAAHPDDGAVGFGRLSHIWWNFHPRQLRVRVDVSPEWQGQGIGSKLLAELLDTARTWDAELVRTEVVVEHARVSAFLERRGFVERRRRWELILDVATANVSSLQAASARVASAGITIVTYAAERDRRGEERLRRDLYDLESVVSQDEPGMDVDGAGMSFERFCWNELDAPNALPEGHFIACLGERLIAVSRLERDLRHPDTGRQGFTGVHPDFRRQSIAQALKLRTIEFARQHGYRQLSTSNDASNAPMLSVNERVGFRRERPLFIYERRLQT